LGANPRIGPEHHCGADMASPYFHRSVAVHRPRRILDNHFAMFKEVQEFISEMSAEFTSGNVDALIKRLSCPAALYFGDDLIVIRDRADLENLAETYLEGLRTMGLRKSSTMLDSLSTTEDGAMVASTTSVFMNAEDRPVGIGRATYFLRVTDGVIRMEMSQHSPTQISAEDVNGSLARLKV
jgi:hypothetical protein